MAKSKALRRTEKAQPPEAWRCQRPKDKVSGGRTVQRKPPGTDPGASCGVREGPWAAVRFACARLPLTPAGPCAPDPARVPPSQQPLGRCGCSVQTNYGEVRSQPPSSVAQQREGRSRPGHRESLSLREVLLGVWPGWGGGDRFFPSLAAAANAPLPRPCLLHGGQLSTPASCPDRLCTWGELL